MSNSESRDTNTRWGLAWDTFLADKSESGFMQSWNYARVLQASGWEYFDAFLLADDQSIQGGARVFIGQIKLGQVFFYIPDGPVLSDDPAIASVQYRTMLDYIDSMRQEQQARVTHLRIEPRWQQRPAFIDSAYEIDGWLEPRSTIYVDLTGTEEQLLARMKQKGRYNIRVARRNDVRIVQDNTEKGFKDFIELYQRTMNRKQVDSMDSSYLANLFKLFGSTNDISLFFAEYQGERITAGMVVYFAQRATYFFTGSDKSHSRVMAPYLMTWEIMLHAQQRGHTAYDLYGIAPPDQPDHPFAVFTRFKTMFGGNEVHMVPTLDYIFHEKEYRDYRASQE